MDAMDNRKMGAAELRPYAQFADEGSLASNILMVERYTPIS